MADLFATGVQIPDVGAGSSRPADLTGFIRLYARNNVLYGRTPTGQEFPIVGAGGVTSIEGLTGAVDVAAGPGATVSTQGQTLTIGGQVRPFVEGAALPTTTPLKLWMGSALTNSGGVFEVDWSSAGFTQRPLFVSATAELTTTNVYDVVWATMSGAITATAGGGYAIRGVSQSILLINTVVSTRIAPTGTKIKVMALGV